MLQRIEYLSYKKDCHQQLRSYRALSQTSRAQAQDKCCHQSHSRGYHIAFGCWWLPKL